MHVCVCAHIIYYNNQTKQYEIFVLNLLKTILTFLLLSFSLSLSLFVDHATMQTKFEQFLLENDFTLVFVVYTYKHIHVIHSHCLFHFESNDLQMHGD